MASASVSCASLDSEPCDMAPVENRVTMVVAGSTSSRGTGAPAGTSSRRSCSSMAGRSLTRAAKLSYKS